MKNYYFKFQKGNTGFDIIFNSHNHYHHAFELRKNKVIIPLSIYYGNWRSNELQFGLDSVKKKKGLGDDDYSRSLEQIKTFYKLSDLNEEVFFWSFYEDIIICFEPISLNIIDGPEEFIDKNGSYPKSIQCIIRNVYNKIDLPEIFSNINSNQRYNRGTISELSGLDNEIAKSLLKNKKIKINNDNIIKYLSPMEFETLLFMIFSNEKVLCSSYRGGTLKDYDLRIKVNQEFHGIPQGSYWIQVKMKDKIKNTNSDSYYAYLGKSDLENKIIGYDWIIQRVMENNIIKKWLIEMIYNYSIYQTS